MAIHTQRLSVSEAGKYVLLGIVALLFVFPIYSLITSSFRPGRDLMRYGVTFASIIPNFFSTNNYTALITGHSGEYPVWYRNSILLAFFQTGFTLAFSSFVGYGLGVYQFKGRNALTMLVLVILIVPLQILILPLYKLTTTLHAMNTFPGILLPFIVSPFAIFFFRQYAVGIPKDYLDAGRIDGLSEYSIFFRISAPLMIPAFGAMAILVAQQSWNNFLWPLIVVTTANMFTLTIGLNSLLTPYGNNYDMLIAGSCAASVPIIIVFFFFQKYFISGLSAGGIKG
ncbi:MAG: carbohydrate ABC transporter permease [Spirochaetia bacterium]|jgi:arabinosaccharide transport system permease protein